MITSSLSLNFATAPSLYALPGFHEPFSAISHLFGFVLFLYLGALLLRRGRGDTRRMIYLSVYAGSCVLLMAMSTVYHMMVRGGVAHQVMERLDHSAIFILIAGTFTPPHGILFRGRLRWGMLTLIWTCAILGVTMKSIFFNQVSESLGLAFYLGLGWLGLFSTVILYRRYGFRFIKPVLCGGIAYTIGGVMDYQRWFVAIPGVVQSHELFHVAVLVGAICHWVFIWQFANAKVMESKPCPDDS